MRVKFKRNTDPYKEGRVYQEPSELMIKSRHKCEAQLKIIKPFVSIPLHS